MGTLLILICLLIGFYTGWRRRFALQGVYTIGYVISFIIARIFYQSLAKKIELWVPYPSANEHSHFVFYKMPLALRLDMAFYSGVAFLMIVMVGWLVTRFIGLFFQQYSRRPVTAAYQEIVGGVLGFLMVYIGLFLILYTLSFIPLDGVQHFFKSSFLARFMVAHTPFLSKMIYHWWISAMVL